MLSKLCRSLLKNIQTAWLIPNLTYLIHFGHALDYNELKTKTVTVIVHGVWFATRLIGDFDES